ncbi:type II toxin-antitoxin system VapC family toxin [Mucilaginibacter glaciei]|uniref:Type II toxin-antitoxin system VapC family toxin n=1 Tax=Mucilaginibacter glaciei TaxID=2772109 RepID=A0A926S261_9SPHI|nr:type II toxin-antitoxin system VapC family toxin [Mucilaginibacter glaciei]MBD1393522.1 type II toxin-antitoxin system VapC family toxin [Mucilaginibacter glaciei]
MSTNKYLLDTHCLIWFQQNNSSLPKRVVEIIQDADNAILFSQTSLFELAIKLKLVKLDKFSISIEEFYLQAIADGFEYLPTETQHLYAYGKVPLFENHRDPFDTLLIATATEEKATILSGDEKFGLYKDIVNVVW